MYADLIEKKEASLVIYCLDEKDPTDPVTYLPKRMNLAPKEYGSMLHAATGLYIRREEHYKRMVSTDFHRFLLHVAHEHLIFHYTEDGHKRLKKSEIKVEKLIHYLNLNYCKKLSGKWWRRCSKSTSIISNRMFVASTGTPYSISSTDFVLTMRNSSSPRPICSSRNRVSCGRGDRYYFSKLFE
jgi:hypothetical protein